MTDYLLLDIGSTNIKYAIYCLERDEIKDSGTTAFPPKIPNQNPLIYEVELAGIQAALDAVFRKAWATSLSGILLSVQMHGYILADADGTCLTPYISWQDRRSLTQYNGSTFFAQFQLQHPHICWSTRGTSCKPNLPLISLYTQAMRSPTLFQQQIQFFTLGSYAAFLLTGQNASHITDCCASGFYDASTGNTACNRNMILPRAYKQLPAIGKYKGVPVYPPMGDHQISFLGCHVQQHQLLLNIGTAAQLSTLSHETSGLYECRPYFDGQALCTVTGLIGGSDIRKNPNICQELAENYRQAIERLPIKSELLICGGGADHYAPLLQKVCAGIGVPYQILHTNPAIAGLVTIVKEGMLYGV